MYGAWCEGVCGMRMECEVVKRNGVTPSPVRATLVSLPE